MGVASASPAPGQATTNPSAAPALAGSGLPAPQPPRRGWWNGAVFYEVFVRSFADANDGPLAGDGIGDFRGLAQRLDHLNDGDPAGGKDLGVTALWLMPIHPSPSYHGYDATDYTGVNPRLGTMDDFKDMLAACKARGVRVIIDLVLNHHSREHPWFKGAADPASPRHDWYLWAETAPDYRGPWGQRVWHSARRSPAGELGPAFYYGIFGGDMPDLNYRSAAVTAAMKDVAAFWLRDVGIDGFRLDAIRHLFENGPAQENVPETYAWLADYSAFCHGLRPDCFLVGEVWSDARTSASYVGPCMESTFDFQLADALVRAAKSGDAGALTRAVRACAAAYPPGSASTFLTNHDQPRVATHLAGVPGGPALAASLLLTLPGTPFLYYGEEIGMTGDKPDPRIRTPMRWTEGPGAGFTTGTPWQALSGDGPGVSVAAQIDDPRSLLSLYRRLIHLRQTHPALRGGAMELLDVDDAGVFAFLRRAPATEGQGDAARASDLLVIANLTARALPCPELAGLPAGVLAADAELLHGAAVTGSVTRPLGAMEPRTVYVLRFPR